MCVRDAMIIARMMAGCGSWSGEDLPGDTRKSSEIWARRGEDVVGTAVAATAAGARLCLLVVIVRRLGG